MEDQPVFITGPDRSGTTLLYALLASHPNIAMVRRTNFWRWFYGRYGDLHDPENFERILSRLLLYKRMQRLEPDGDRIRQEFWKGEPSYGRVLALLLRHNAAHAGKLRWGDKSLHTEHYLDLVMKEFPKARIIHMTRDPRDRYASVRKRFGRDTPRLGAATGRWLSSMQAAIRNRNKYPHQYLIVRYEDLASQPEETARTICKFIDEEFTPLMLTMEGAAEYRNSGGNSSFNQIQPGTITTSPIGRYRRVLSPYELKFIQRFTGKFMQGFEYALDTVKFSTLQTVFFYFWFMPYHFLRMTGWRVIDDLLLKRNPPVPASRFLDFQGQMKDKQVESHV